MKLADLAAYAEKKYQIREQHKWADFPGFSVLSVPLTGKWAALLMRRNDPVTGKESEYCDIKCGADSVSGETVSGISAPFRMRGSKWVGVTFDEKTDPELVYALFDRAVNAGGQQGFTIVLDPEPVREERVYQDIPLPFAGSRAPEPDEDIPEKVVQMRGMYDYANNSFVQKCRNFYRQGKFMEGYQDDFPWNGSFFHYFPTYHDLNVKQLRGYFSWRTNVRKGVFRPIPTSAAYIYIYELLNGIGTNSPEKCLEMLQDFESGFLDGGFGDEKMRENLHRWMFEFAVLNDFPPEKAAELADPVMLKKDKALQFLREPEAATDEDLFEALCFFAGESLRKSPVVVQLEERGRHLFCETWKRALASWKSEGSDFFTECFGSRNAFPWYPLSNAVFWWDHYLRKKMDDSGVKAGELRNEYILNDSRSFLFSGGVWQTVTYENLYFNKEKFRAFCHASDLKLRRYLKTGNYLRSKPEEEWAEVYAEQVIEAEKQALIEAAKPKIKIDFSGLDRIREDALLTRNSLLSEDEIIEMEEVNSPDNPDSCVQDLQSFPGNVPLDAGLLRILQELLSSGSADELLREQKIMPSIAADSINEALFDEFGDTVVSCEDDRLGIVEDYREDILQYLEDKHLL